MLKVLSSAYKPPNPFPQTPPFLNSIILSKTLPDSSVITGRKITNTLEISSKENIENFNKFPIVIESIKNRRTPKEDCKQAKLEKIEKNELFKKLEKPEKYEKNLKNAPPHKISKTIQMKPIIKPLKERNSNENKTLKSKISTTNENNMKETEKNDKITRISKDLKKTKKTSKKTKSPLKVLLEKEELEKKNEVITMTEHEKTEKKPLKKKKKKKTMKKTKKTHVSTEKKLEMLMKSHEIQQNINENNNNIEENPLMNKLLMKSLDDFKAKKLLSLSNKKQKIVIFQEKHKNLNLRNAEIRQSNLERFLKRQDIDPFSSKNFKPPWGLDQQKFKRYYMSRFIREFSLSQELPQRNIYNEPAKHAEIINDEVRRQRLGLEFLKGMPEENIENLIRKSKEKTLENEKLEHERSISKKRVYSEEDLQEIRSFMEKKKEQIENQNIQLLLQDFLTQEKIKQNLQSLNSEIKGIFTSKSSKTLIKKDNFMKSPMKKPLDNPIEEGDESPDSKDFSLLYKEYQEFIKDTAMNSTKKITSDIGSPEAKKKEGGVVERYENIKEKFDHLAKRFEKYIDDKEHNSIIKKNNENLENIEEEKEALRSSEIETNNVINKEKMEEFNEKNEKIKEKNEKNTKINEKKENFEKGEKNQEKNENFGKIEKNLKNYENVENSEKNLKKIEKTDKLEKIAKLTEKPDHSLEQGHKISQKPEITEKPVQKQTPISSDKNFIKPLKTDPMVLKPEKPAKIDKNPVKIEKKEKNDENNENDENDENPSDEMDSEIWGENLQILENIAILIQKVWRGYRTRKILDEYFEIILNGEFIEQMEDEEGGIKTGNEIIMEDELEDQMESMHKENQMKKKSRSAEVLENYGIDDDYKLQEEIFNKNSKETPNNSANYDPSNPNSNKISHNVLYNKPDSKNSEDYEGDKIMHISDIMEDEHNQALSKSQEKSKENQLNSKKPSSKDHKAKAFSEDNLYRKLNLEENIKMPNADIITSTDEFRRKLKEELDTDQHEQAVYEVYPRYDLEEMKEKSDDFEDQFEKKSKKPRYSEIDSSTGENPIENAMLLSYKRKNKLMLNVEEIEKEHQIHEKFNELSNKNSEKLENNISEIRKTLCSEKLVREQSARSLTQIHIPKPLKLKPNSESLEDPMLRDSRDSRSKESKENPENISIFEKDPFKEFTYKLYQDLVHNDKKEVKEDIFASSFKNSFNEKKEKETPKSAGGVAKRGIVEKWVNSDDGQQGGKRMSPLNDQKWNSPFYGFKKTQRDVFLLQRAVSGENTRNSYYNSYYSDEADNKPPGNDFDQLAFLSKSWHGFNTQQKKPSLNIINQLGENITNNIFSGSSKNIKIIEKFEVKEENKGNFIDSDEKKEILKLEDLQQKIQEGSSKNSSFKQAQNQDPPNFAGDSSSISRSGKIKLDPDTNRIPIEEDVALDDEVNFKPKDEVSQILSNDVSGSGNKLKLPGPEGLILEGLPLDKSVGDSNLINNELIIKDEKAYKKDLNITTIGNIVLDELLIEFQQDVLSNEVLSKKLFEFQRISQIPPCKPINTTIYAVDEYLNILNNFIRDRFSNEFLQNINQPYDKDALAKLRLYNEAKFDNSNKEFQIKPVDILPAGLFFELEDIIMSEESEEAKAQISIELDHIHKRLLFDCLNESLEYFRPFDIRGKPTPWKLNQKKLTYSDIDQSNMDIVLEQAKNKVMEWSMFQCGMLAEGEGMMGYLNYDLLNQMKQERLEKMIINEIYEKEEKWICYDDWESVVQIEISDLIMENLLLETIKEVNSIKNA